MALLNENGPAAAVDTSTRGQQADKNSYLSTADVLDYTKDPNLYAQFGSQNMTGFLEMNGQTKMTSSDQFEFYQEKRLNPVVKLAAADAAAVVTDTAGQTINVASATDYALINVGSILLLDNADGNAVVVTDKGTSPQITIQSVDGDIAVADFNGAEMRVLGQIVGKSSSPSDGIESGMEVYRNKTMIIRRDYEIAGGDASAIVWFNTSDPATGRSGKAWTFKGEGDQYRRFVNDREMVLLTSVENTDSDLPADLQNGFFEQIKNGSGFADFTPSGGVDAEADATTVLHNIDAIVDELDADGIVSTYALWQSLKHRRVIDDMLRFQNGFSGGGLSYGMFGYDSEKMVSFKFKGFDRDGIEFYSSKWDVLSDKSYLGNSPYYQEFSVGVPMSDLYDPETKQPVAGVSIVVKETESGTEGGGSRSMRHWYSGGASPAMTDGDDVIRLHYIAERGIQVSGARNFFKLEG